MKLTGTLTAFISAGFGYAINTDMEVHRNNAMIAPTLPQPQPEPLRRLQVLCNKDNIKIVLCQSSHLL